VLAGARVEPAEPMGGTDVNCIPGAATDADGDPVSFRYAWTVNGQDVGVSGGTLEGEGLEKGDQVECMVTPEDGQDLGKAVRSGEVEIGNTPPTAEAPTLGPAEATTDTTLVCAPNVTSDPDGDLIEVRYLWKVGGMERPGSDDHLAGDQFRRGDTVVCAVVVSDGSASVTAESASIEIANSPPVVGQARIDPESPQTEHTLTCIPDEVVDPDDDEVSIAFAWMVDGRTVESDGATLSASATLADQRVACSVTPSDGDLAGSPVHSEAVVIGNTPPVLVGVTLSPVAPTVVDTLVCEHGDATDADGDAVTFRYRWTVSKETANASKRELRAPTFRRGDVVRCAVSPSDGRASGAEVGSAEVTVRNSLPVLTGARIEPAIAYADTALACMADGAEDPDGDEVEVRFAWTVDDAPVGTSATLAPGSFRKGQEVRCTASPFDGTDDGAPVSVAVVVRNRPPVVQSVEVAPEEVYTNDTITASASAHDADGDPVTFTWRWSVRGRNVEVDDNALDGTLAFGRGDRVQVTASPHDGEEVGDPMASAVVQIRNSRPSAPQIAIDDPRGGTADLVCRVVEPASDPDGNQVRYRFQWVVEDAPFPSARTTALPGDTVPRAAIGLDQDWTCVVTPRDDLEEGPSSEPDTVTIVEALVGSGSSHACALRTTGDLLCWGNRDYAMNRPPKEAARQLAVGGWHNCAIRQADRGLMCWGHDVYGQSRPPSGRFRRVTAGGWHSCALDMDSHLTCWGQGADGRTEAPPGVHADVSAGWNHTCALDPEGGVICWGDNEHGQCDALEGRFVQVSAGEFHSCALNEDGEIQCWGSNRASELDAPPGPFVAVEVGARFTCGLRSVGAVACWGMDNYGQLEVPDRVFRRIGRGVNNICGWTEEERLECWGQDQYGQSRPPR
ncbi:MAG: hypothetical protein JRI25_19155, partial [Deltaproteobacteria bacterium]|nr:hypothetical protein [Deltaproteobacteria bacterium]